jgi:hypothetical protein
MGKEEINDDIWDVFAILHRIGIGKFKLDLDEDDEFEITAEGIEFVENKLREEGIDPDKIDNEDLEKYFQEKHSQNIANRKKGIENNGRNRI